MASPGPMRVLLASNRGPVSFTRGDDGTLTARGGAGGLAAALSTLRRSDVLWVCAALSDDDRAAARSVPGGRLATGHGPSLSTGDEPTRDAGTGSRIGQVRMLDIDPVTFSQAYNQVANSTLWFVHHLLFDTATAPVFDVTFRQAWDAYVRYNRAFAEALAEDAAPESRVLVQDYHLTLTPRLLRELRPDLAIGHFSHTPWAPPDYFRLLPDDVAGALLDGVLAADHAGFLTARWAAAFLDCCETVLGAVVDRAQGTVEHAGRTTRVAVHPLGVDAATFRARADEPDVRDRMADLRTVVGDRRLLVRVDRAELSKNIVRGLLAYRELLRRHPEWHDRVVHVALAYASRHEIPEYRAYAATARETAARINDEFGHVGWQPLVFATDDDYARSLAAYRMADAAIVNPVRDGMNLVVKEIAVTSDRGCALVLSREAGAAVELGGDALLVNPFDVEGTAEALHTALAMTDGERRARTARLARLAAAHPPQRWLGDQLAALDQVAAQ